MKTLENILENGNNNIFNLNNKNNNRFQKKF